MAKSNILFRIDLYGQLDEMGKNVIKEIDSYDH